jgi:hypothetical protein
MAHQAPLLGWPDGRIVPLRDKSAALAGGPLDVNAQELSASYGLTMSCSLACRLLSRQVMKTNQQKGGTS